MPSRVLILGGYGNFGKRIAQGLARHRVPTLIAGRDRAKAEALAAKLPEAEALVCDAAQPLEDLLAEHAPACVVNTVGPFQGSGYDVARACIASGVGYVDIADGRAFVTGIASLDREAEARGVAVVSGASTVPGLSSAVIERFQGEFSKIASLRFGISPGQRAERGLATTKGILSYVGKPLKPFAGQGGTR